MAPIDQVTQRCSVNEEAEAALPALTLPDGYRVWRRGDDSRPTPSLRADAYHGPLGEYLRLVEGETEAHPAAIGAHLLAGFATMIGAGPVYVAGSIRHHCNLFAAVVGPSSTGGKGVAQAEANRLLTAVDPRFHQQHTMAGLGSGEMLVCEVRDPDPNDPDDGGGVKERIIQNAELSSTFKVSRREGNILGDHLRLAFDGSPMRHSTRKDGVTSATGHHISIVGSITPTELRKLLDDTSRTNGFGNRFLYVWAEIGELLPFGGNVPASSVQAIADRIIDRLDQFEQRVGAGNGTLLYEFGQTARPDWDRFYRRARRGLGTGLTADLTRRAIAHAVRIALIYAVLDGSTAIEAKHIAAAEAWVNYGHKTVEKVFGVGVSGLAGTLLTAIRTAGPDGMTLTEQSDLFNRNQSAGELKAARHALEADHLITTCTTPGEHSRPVHRSLAICPIGRD